MTSQIVSTKTAARRFRFITGIWSELKKVVWLSRKEIVYLTTLVLLVALAATVLLGLFDLGFSTAVDKLLLNK